MEETFQKVPVDFQQQLMWSFVEHIDYPLTKFDQQIKGHIIDFIATVSTNQQHEFFAFLWQTFADSLGSIPICFFIFFSQFLSIEYVPLF
jgi:hypothetical protein